MTHPPPSEIRARRAIALAIMGALGAFVAVFAGKAHLFPQPVMDAIARGVLAASWLTALSYAADSSGSVRRAALVFGFLALAVIAFRLAL